MRADHPIGVGQVESHSVDAVIVAARDQAEEDARTRTKFGTGFRYFLCSAREV